MGTKNQPGAFDCYANAGDDEPMFVLLARDKHAPTLVWLWATLRELDSEDPAKVREARDCAESMIVWAAENGRKSAGLGLAALAAVMELVRICNIRAEQTEPQNAATGNDAMRLFLGVTKFQTPESP